MSEHRDEGIRDEEPAGDAAGASAEGHPAAASPPDVPDRPASSAGPAGSRGSGSALQEGTRGEFSGSGSGSGSGSDSGSGAQAAVTPADTADAARLVSFGLHPKLLPARDAEYAELLRRYRDEPAFARLADAVATGLGLVVLEVSTRAGMALAADEESVFAVRMGDYSRRATADSADRFLHGLAHLAVAAMAFPRPEDLADDGYIGRITVNGVDSFVRQACRRLEEHAEETGENADPVTGAPGLEAAWRVYARRSATGATKDARRLAGSTTGIIGKAVAFLVDSGFLQRTGDDAGGTYRTTPRYQLQVRDMAGSAAMSELLELGVVPVSDGSASLLPPGEGDDVEIAGDAALPFHS
ncbi:hypothetical protein ACFPA8_21405 [Streptomyces ovatisporus]|uniref:Uncharacterized protein n=1 Tax=Streptomyces ovatisporus TaxID=1128682 RepID=A0ABV9ABL9_9ACTN